MNDTTTFVKFLVLEIHGHTCPSAEMLDQLMAVGLKTWNGAMGSES